MEICFGSQALDWGDGGKEGIFIITTIGELEGIKMTTTSTPDVGFGTDSSRAPKNVKGLHVTRMPFAEQSPSCGQRQLGRNGH